MITSIAIVITSISRVPSSMFSPQTSEYWWGLDVCPPHWPAKMDSVRLLATDLPGVVTIDEVTSLANDAEFYRRIKTMKNRDQ